MSTRKSTTARREAQPEPETLNDAEVGKLADRLAAVLVADHIHASENVSLMTLLFDHLQHVEREPNQLQIVIDTVKRSLFSATEEATRAQEHFQAEAFRNRGKLLLFPYERKGAS